MHLSRETIALIKNFAGINSNLRIVAGNKLATASASKTIIAESTIEETFPSDFGIYDLNEFLGALSLFDEADLQFTTKYVKIGEGKDSIRYFAADPNILTPLYSIKQFPTDAEVEFTLTSAMLSQIQKVASILKVTDFSIVGDGATISIGVNDKTNPTGNSFVSEIGESDKVFKVNIKSENLKMSAGDYEVSVSSKKISRFKSTNSSLLYYVAIEADSTFEL